MKLVCQHLDQGIIHMGQVKSESELAKSVRVLEAFYFLKSKIVSTKFVFKKIMTILHYWNRIQKITFQIFQQGVCNC